LDVEQLAAFNKIKLALDAAFKLHFIDEAFPITLQTDASDYAVGGFLFQTNMEGVILPIRFVSKAFAAQQLRWSTPEKEAYAIVYAVTELRSLLLGRKFLLETDHQNLTFIDSGASPKILRWKLHLQEYDFSIRHIAGVKNIIADSVSRLCVSKPLLPPRSRLEGSASLDAPTVNSILDVCAPIICNPDRKAMIEAVHNAGVGHFGLNRTYAKLVEKGIVWPDMRDDIRLFIKQCPYCQFQSTIKPIIHSLPYTLATYAPMEMLCIDTIGPLPADDLGNQYIIAIIDAFTRYLALYPSKSTDACSAAEAILSHIGRFGHPAYILSDRGTQFCNEVCDTLMHILGIQHKLTQPYSHEENSIIERSNKEVMRHLRGLIFDRRMHNTWSMRFCPLVERIHNAQVHSAIGVSPAQLLFGNMIQLDRRVILPTSNLTSKVPYGTSQMKYLDDLISAQDRLLRIAGDTQQRLDSSNRQKRSMKDASGESLPLTVFPINSFVLLANNRVRDSKFQTNWVGPYRVINSSVEGNYVIQDLLTLKNVNARVNHLKEFVYDNSDYDAPWRAATHAKGEYYIESILNHRGDKRNKTQMSFLVKWAGYPEEYNSWEPWSSLRDTEQLELYLRNNRMRSLLPVQKALSVK
jgi:hypothetical protein